MLEVRREESMLWVRFERSLDLSTYHFVKSFFNCSKCFLLSSCMLSISFFNAFSSAPMGLDCYFKLKISFSSFSCSGSSFSRPYTKLFTAFSRFIFYNLSFLYWIWLLISFITFPSSFPFVIFYPSRATFFSMASCLLYERRNCSKAWA